MTLKEMYESIGINYDNVLGRLMTEALVKSLTVDQVYDRFAKTVENLVIAGVSERLAYNRAMVSINGNVNNLPLIFAEKAFMLSVQLSKRIPHKS